MRIISNAHFSDQMASLAPITTQYLLSKDKEGWHMNLFLLGLALISKPNEWAVKTPKS